MLNIFKWDWWRSGISSPKQNKNRGRSSFLTGNTNEYLATVELLQSNENFLQKIVPRILERLSIPELTRLLCRQDPSISRIHNDFQIFTTLDYELTCENEMGQRILDDFQLRLLQNRNNFGGVLAKLFSSILTEGTYCFEITVDQFFVPTNLFVIHPNSLHFKSRRTQDGEVWDIGQYNDDKFIVLSPDRVFFDAINPLVDDLRGHSLIAPAFKSAVFSASILENLVQIINKMAYPKRKVILNIIECLEKNLEDDVIDEIREKLRETVASPAFQDPTKVPVMEGPVTYENVDDAPNNLTLVDTVDRVMDRKTIRGGGASPTYMGSNEFTAESSAKSQGLRESVRIESFQKRVENLMGYALTMVLRYAGITEPAQLFLKRIDIVERELEADVIQKMSVAVGNLVTSGIPVKTAIRMFSEMTGTHISQQLIEEIEEANAEPD